MQTASIHQTRNAPRVVCQDPNPDVLTVATPTWILCGEQEERKQTSERSDAALASFPDPLNSIAPREHPSTRRSSQMAGRFEKRSRDAPMDFEFTDRDRMRAVLAPSSPFHAALAASPKKRAPIRNALRKC